MTELPTAQQIIDTYIRIAKEATSDTARTLAYVELGIAIEKVPGLAFMLLMAEVMGPKGIFLDGILIGMALAETRQLEALSKL